jgi:hypothetical protein
LRGLKSSVGTGHASGEAFLVADNSVAHIAVPDSHVGATYNVKVVSPGQTLVDVTAVSVTIIARTPTATETAISTILSPTWITPETLTLTQDDTWRSASCSSAVPTDAQALILYVQFDNSSGSTSFKTLQVRKNSGSQAYKVAGAASGSGGDTTAAGIAIASPVGKTFEYKIPSGWTVTVEVQGYYRAAG